MHPFAYHRPADLDEAARLLAGLDGARPLAGGQSLLPALKHRRERPAHLVDLGGIAALRGIAREPGHLVLGAMTRHHEIAASETVAVAIPALARMMEVVGDPAVRHLGTVGGALAANDPAGDYPAAALALRAVLATQRREIAAEAFLAGPGRTALEPDEIVTAIRLAVPERAAYAKFRHPASRWALAGVFVARFGDGETRLAVTGAGREGAFRWREAEAALGADFSAAALAGLRLPPTALASDLHADAGYRAHLVGVMARRAVAAALAS